MKNDKLLVVGLFTFAITATACVTRVESPQRTAGAPVASTVGTVGASVVVEQFLRAANAKDLNTMGTLFGTKDGPISARDPRNQVESQMFLLATLLTHQDYKIQGERVVPGRSEQATQLDINLTLKDRSVVVPFVMVRTNDGKWLVECFEVERITSQRGSRPCSNTGS